MTNVDNTDILNTLACTLLIAEYRCTTPVPNQFDYQKGNHIVSFTRVPGIDGARSWDVVRHAPITNRWGNAGLFNFEIRLSCLDTAAFFDDERMQEAKPMDSKEIAMNKFLVSLETALKLDVHTQPKP